MSHLGILESNLSGSGFDCLRAAYDLGHRVTFFTRDLDRYLEVPGAQAFFDKYVERIEHCETNDDSLLSKSVDAIALTDPFDAFLTVAEYDVVLAARTSARLGLPTVSESSVAKARDKARMRETCAAAGVPMPDFRIVWSAAEAASAAREVGLPCVVKPADETSSAEVSRCTTAEQAAAAFNRILARTETTRGQDCSPYVMVEQCVFGPEVSVEVMAEGDRFRVLGVTDKSLAGQDRFVELAHVFPSALPPEQAQACADTAVQALRAVGFDLGLAHVEVKTDGEGAKLIEINPRPAGGRITELVDLSFGISTLELVVRQYFGESVLDTIPEQPVAGAAIRYLTACPGTVSRVAGVESAEAMAGVREVLVKAHPGDTVRPLARNGDRLGHVLAVADHPYTAARVAEAAVHAIAIHTGTGPAQGDVR
ncbi:ATP-grasp domain-containing protein [Streptacidiphilus sp. N1-12]|uniref:ATP-grasp domain-containing protein n=2 Tax=Streptacidiphilus alkalitolerans TaxID=3342712 RepID=A0ABV6V7I9_9ACTN